MFWLGVLCGLIVGGAVGLAAGYVWQRPKKMAKEFLKEGYEKLKDQ